jgi:hypothetical protein
VNRGPALGARVGDWRPTAIGSPAARLSWHSEGNCRWFPKPGYAKSGDAAEKLTPLWLDHLFEQREVQVV